MVERVALVIGNSAYEHAETLKNPVNDAELIREGLKEAGFDNVSKEIDLKYEAMRAAIIRFADAAKRADMAIIYYAGHGVEVNGKNYLIPIDASLSDESDVHLKTTPLDHLLAAAGRARHLRLIILDACRDNPFRNMMHSQSMRGLSRGLANEAGDNVLVAYAAKAGDLAYDGDGVNSPYAIALRERLPTPDLEINKVFGYVRDDVVAKTKNSQHPYTYGSMGGQDIYLVPNKHGMPVKQVDEKTLEHNKWVEIGKRESRGILKLESVEVFINRFPTGEYIEEAKFKAEDLINLAGDIVVLDNFIQKFPNSERRQLAEARLGAITLAGLAGSHDPEMYRSFIRRFREMNCVGEVHSARASLASLLWPPLRKSNDEGKLQGFVDECDGTNEAEAAKQRLTEIRVRFRNEKEWWERIRSGSDTREIRRFIKTYPDGRCAELAKARLAELEALAASSVTDEERNKARLKRKNNLIAAVILAASIPCVLLSAFVIGSAFPSWDDGYSVGAEIGGALFLARLAPHIWRRWHQRLAGQRELLSPETLLYLASVVSVGTLMVVVLRVALLG
jgi:hypothetical protein